MSTRSTVTVDGNEAVASVAHRLSETVAIYPITPSSTMAELCDEWSARGQTNLWGGIPDVVQMQSEAGVAGAVHGALQAGAMTTTFTASQGLLLMIPNMYKIAGELTPFCMHVAARTIATHALSIFGDHSDVMACRQVGFAMLASGSVQEAHDFAAVAHVATLRSRVPFLHFFDGFRTSHEVRKIEALGDDDLRALFDEGAASAHRARALTPDRPVLRGTAQNPDTWFQAREACNGFYDAVAGHVREGFDALAARTGRRYGLFDYVGHPEADRVIVMMGSGAEVAHEAVDWMVARGERVGLVKVRLYRPFDAPAFLASLPATARSLAVLDRTKEPGAVGEPLYQDVVTALAEAGRSLRVVGGRYGLSSKEFDPAMVRAVYANLLADRPRNHFTVGIVDDVTHTSLEWDRDFDVDFPGRTQAVFYGLGADGTVGANKNTIKIIGEETDHDAQGYFVYDSKKSGATTTSHLRFGPGPIRSSYLVKQASFVGVHQFQFLQRLDVLDVAAPGAVVLINAPYAPGEVWDRLPREVQAAVVEKGLRVHVIDGSRVARAAGMGGRVNTIMQTCFFAISGVLPRDEAIAKIKHAIEKSYGRKGPEVVARNFAAIDATLANLHRIEPGEVRGEPRPPVVPDEAPDFVKRVTAVMMSSHGDRLPVSAFPVDGTWPTGTAKWEKRSIAAEIPVWDPTICIQCNKCAFVCPHAAIRAKTYEATELDAPPAGFKSMAYKAPGQQGVAYTIQVAPDDCTGCRLCVEVCPAKDKSNPRHKALDMAPQAPLRAGEAASFAYFEALPELRPDMAKLDVKTSQLLPPLFEFSGACSGCGETPYVKLVTQLFGDRVLVANATGCSSIYGGNLPTTPYTTNREGRGPAWSNSLFEDNAEFGFGLRLGIDAHRERAERLLKAAASRVGEDLVAEMLTADQSTDAGVGAQRDRVTLLRGRLPAGDALAELADYLVKKSVWIVGGDGWAYDIGFGGLDHVLSTDKDVNVLVLDTEVYSNTGGQQSKATPLAAAAKFAAAGKTIAKKDLGLMAMGYGSVYVARVAFGAKDQQTLRALQEAESYRGPSLVIAYSHCIAHGYDLSHGLEQQKRAVDSATWPLYRFDPRRIAAGEPPLKLDSGPPKLPVKEYMKQEARFRIAEASDPARYRELLQWAQRDAERRYAVYEQLSKVVIPQVAAIPDKSPPPTDP
ncbi:MAG: pyruvate:ferredoxin (flavodoxin) oxidoreductase [Myxococcota bacterium]